MSPSETDAPLGTLGGAESASPTCRGNGNGNPKPAGTVSGSPRLAVRASAPNVERGVAKSSSERHAALKSSTTSPGVKHHESSTEPPERVRRFGELPGANVTAHESSTEPPPPERVRRFGELPGANVTVDRVRRWRSRLGSRPPRGRAASRGGAPTVAVRRAGIDAPGSSSSGGSASSAVEDPSVPKGSKGTRRVAKGRRAGNNGGADGDADGDEGLGDAGASSRGGGDVRRETDSAKSTSPFVEAA